LTDKLDPMIAQAFMAWMPVARQRQERDMSKSIMEIVAAANVLVVDVRDLPELAEGARSRTPFRSLAACWNSGPVDVRI